MKKKYLALYYELCKDNSMSCAALCVWLGKNDKLFKLVKPTRKDPERDQYVWGYGTTDWDHPPSDCKKIVSFTPLRRNLLLLIAAMAGEL